MNTWTKDRVWVCPACGAEAFVKRGLADDVAVNQDTLDALLERIVESHEHLVHGIAS